EESPGQPVVGEDDGSDPGRIVGFVLAQPAQLCAGERGDGQDSGAGNEVLGPDLGDEIAGGGIAAQIVPQKRVADDASLAVEGDEPVLLAADADRGHIVEAPGGGDRRLQRGPPLLGIHLGAGRVRGRTGAHDGSGVGIGDDDLAALRRGVDSGEVPAGRGHRCSSSAADRSFAESSAPDSSFAESSTAAATGAAPASTASSTPVSPCPPSSTSASARARSMTPVSRIFAAQAARTAGARSAPRATPTVVVARRSWSRETAMTRSSIVVTSRPAASKSRPDTSAMAPSSMPDCRCACVRFAHTEDRPSAQ